MVKLNHISLAVEDFESYRTLFMNLGMRVVRNTGEKPCRQTWFDGGIQLVEEPMGQQPVHFDYIALDCENVGSVKTETKLCGFRDSAKGAIGLPGQSPF